MTGGDLLERSLSFRSRLWSVKTARPDVLWYPYDSLTNLTHLEKLLGAQPRNLLDLLPNRRVLDVGTGDGDFAFFLESQGYEVEAVDLAASNHSALVGFRTLHAALQSQVKLHEVDIDRQFRLEGQEYGLALSLGLLYHLKNPFYFLEELSLRAHYCLASCKIADVLEASGARDLSGAPLAYLLESDELNEDNSNFWVFTESCLKRLFNRSGWVVLDSMRVGTAGGARVDSATDDARLFALLASRRLGTAMRLEEGFYEKEPQGWRWTAPRFKVTVPLTGCESRSVVVEGYVAAALLEGGKNGLNCRVGTGPVQRREMREEGPALFRFDLATAGRTDVSIEFWLDRETRGTGDENRTLGMIVADVQLT